MTEQKSFKRHVRERMDKTGESYTAARKHAVEKKSRTKKATDELVAQGRADLASDELVRENTGRGWDEWFEVLDSWGAIDRSHGEIARYLIEDLKVPGWYAQTVTVGYERIRQGRAKYQRADGFSISASKTIHVPVESLFEAFVDDRRRKGWMTDDPLTLRTSKPNKSARYNWEDGTSRVIVWFEGKGESKSTVALAHERLPDADEAQAMKAMWKELLESLKAYLAR